MPKRIRIGSVPFTTTDTTINTAFAPFGTLVSLAINRDAFGNSLGHADGEYTTEAAAAAAIAAMNGSTIDGSVITVSEGR